MRLRGGKRSIAVYVIDPKGGAADDGVVQDDGAALNEEDESSLVEASARTGADAADIEEAKEAQQTTYTPRLPPLYLKVYTLLKAVVDWIAHTH